MNSLSPSSTRTTRASTLPDAACGNWQPRSRSEGLPRRRRPQLRGRATAGQVFNNESCWLISVDGAEDDEAWEVLEEVLAAKRSRNDRLPIFLFGDELTAEMVPTRVLRARECLHAPVRGFPEFMARAIVRAAQLYLERLPPPMFKALMDYTLQCQLLLAHAGPWRRRRIPQEPGRPAVLRVLRREHLAVRHLGVGGQRSARCSTIPVRSPQGERNAARIFGADETLFVVGGTSTANKIVWHGMVEPRRPRAVRPQLPQVDPAFADHDRRDADLPDAVAQRPRDHRSDLARAVHAGVDREEDCRKPVRQGDERQGAADGDDQLDL